MVGGTTMGDTIEMGITTIMVDDTTMDITTIMGIGTIMVDAIKPM